MMKPMTVVAVLRRASRRRAAARVDPLTGLPGRGVAHELLHPAPRDRSLVVMDVDGLDHINRLEGRAQGDDVLRRLAGSIRAQLRPEEFAIRWGGDEIVAVGGSREIDAFIGEATRVVDLGDRALVPGFIDAHGHLAIVMRTLGFVNASSPPVGPAESVEDVVAAAVIGLYRAQGTAAAT